MIKETIVIDAETGEAQKGIDNLTKSVDKLGNKVDEIGADSSDNLGSIKKSSSDSAKGVGTLTAAFRGVGLAIKAAGIGLIVGLLATLKQVFEENQKVADLFNITFEATSLIFNDFVDFLIDNTKTVTDFFKNIFENPLESVKSLGEAIQDNLIERAKSLLEVYGFVGDAIAKLFEGDFKGALDSVKEAGKEMVDAFTGVDGTTEKVADGLAKVASAAADYGKEIVNNAKENVKLQNEAEIATAQQSRLVEQYDRQAEKLRQIRDNDLLTLSERTEANDKLLVVLNNQEDAMLKQAKAQVKAAQAAVDKNANIENQIALTDALANKEGVLAQIEGFRSEQDSNRNALKKEELELTNSQKEAEGQLLISQLEGNAELLTNEHAKLLALRAAADEEKRIQEDLLTSKRDSYKEGTQAYQDANNELLAFQVENTQKQTELDREITQSKIDAFDTAVALAGAETGLGKALLVAKQIMNAKELVLEITKTIAFSTQAAARSTVAVAEGTARTAKIGFPQNIPMLIGYAAQAVGIIGAIKSATSKAKAPISLPSSSTISSGVRSAAPQSPSFNIVGSSETNQLAEAIGSQSQQPVRAYVVSGDVSTAQSLDRNIVESASL
tara:strand:- start:1026 stop:2867 length:1842 start_codon:yes stop_codon:yes gene_type:complete